MTDIDRRIADEYEQNQGPRKQLQRALRLLIGCAPKYAATDDHGRRLENQTFTNGVDITEDEQAQPRLAEPYETTHPNPGSCSSTSSAVDVGRQCPNLAQSFGPIVHHRPPLRNDCA